MTIQNKGMVMKYETLGYNDRHKMGDISEEPGFIIIPSKHVCIVLNKKTNKISMGEPLYAVGERNLTHGYVFRKAAKS